MNTIKISTTQNIEVEYDLASLGERIVGYIIDGLIILAYVIAIVLLLVNGSGYNGGDWMIFLLFIPIFFYDLVSEVLMNGQSVGKRVMNIKVVSLNGGQPTLGQYLIRWLFRLVDFSLTNCLCGVISIAVSERKQRVGDMVAGTAVVRTLSRTGLHQTLYVPTEQESYSVTFPQVVNLAEKDMQLIKEVINEVNKSGNLRLAAQASDKIQQTLNISTHLPPEAFLHTVLSDYNYLASQ